MSPSKQKSNERQAARDGKSSSRQVTSGGTSANAYNPSSGTFHALESIPTDTAAGYLNGRFRSIDDVEDNASTNGGAGEVECMSNNGSYSGESEDQNGKGAGKLGSQSGVVGGADKRDKVRGKNERKHQRQKERRAQELRDKCTGYLMSRKLEALSQQLVAMGFSQERATMALIFNDGHVERSVAWLLEGGEGQVHEDWNSGGNPKIDISEELGYMLEIEKAYKFSRPDIERAVVLCEGDLSKALECLRARSRSLSPGREEGQNVRGASNDSSATRKEESSASIPAAPPGPGPSQSRSNGVVQPSYQVRKDERVSIQPTKGRPQGSSISPHASLEILTRGSAHPRKLSNSSIDLQSSLPPAERRVQAQGARIPLGSVKTQPPYTSQYPPVSKPHTSLVFGFGGADPKMFPVSSRDALHTSSKESVSIGQPHLLMRTSSQPIGGLSNSPAPSPIPSSPALSSSSRSHSFMDVGSPSSVLYVSAGHGDAGMKEINVRKKSMKSLDTGASDLLGYLNPMGSLQSSELPASYWGYPPSNEISVAPSLSSAMHSRSSSGSSYGLFTGWGAGLSHSSVDWSTGPLPNCDYRNIDWSMNASPTTSRGISDRLNSLSLQEKASYFWNSDEERGFHRGLGSAGFATESMQGRASWKGVSGPIVQENMSSESGSTTAHEWTSPFAGKDLFNLPQAVPSPSL
eukprot:c20599_g1_i2 orf=111-2183(-)